MSFIRCDQGSTPADHHTLAIALGPANRYVHSAYQVSDLDALAAGGEYLRERGYLRSWGIGRHIQGSQIFDYWRDPDGLLVEHFADGDMFDNTLEPGWAPFTASGLAQWGPPATRDFLGTDLKSARHELVSMITALRGTQRIRYQPPHRPTESTRLMTISVLRTSDGWWVKTPTGASKIDTTATTTCSAVGRPGGDPGRHQRCRYRLGGELCNLVSPLTRPCRVVAQMTNFVSHVKDAGMDPASVPLTFFRKASASITGPFDEIVKPEHVKLLDYEVEIGLVIGRAIPVDTTISETNLGEFIAGLVVTNDVSARDIQLPQTQFYEAKSYPTFTPVGPELVLLTGRRAHAVRRSAATPERERRRAAECAGRRRHAVSAAASAAVAYPVSGARPGRSDSHRHPGRHRAERPAEAVGNHGKPVADNPQVEAVLQRSGTQPEVLAGRRHCGGVGVHRRRRHQPRNPAHHSQIRVSDRAIRHVPVVIVGAGPTGVTAATLLAQYGVDCLVLDRWPGVYPQPRAVHLDDEIYRIIARLGIAEEFAAISRPTLGLRLARSAVQGTCRVHPGHLA